MNGQIIRVKFPNSYNNQEYDFFCYIDVKVGDTVVVDTVNGLQIATVSSLNGGDKATKEVVDVVDLDAFNERKKKAAQIKALKSKMNKRVKELQDIALYELMAEKDPEIKEFLDELKKLL